MRKCKSGMFSYFGGKSCMIEKLNRIFADEYYDKYYELFVGSAAVPIRCEITCDFRVINDLDRSIIILCLVFSDESTMYELAEICSNNYLSQALFDEAREKWAEFEMNYKDRDLGEMLRNDPHTLCKYAFYSLVLHLSYYGGVIKDSKVTIEDKHMKLYEDKTQLELFELYNEKLCGAEILNKNAIDIIKGLIEKNDTSNVHLLYLDVPYLPSNESDNKTGGTYKNTMKPEEHLEMLKLLAQLSEDTHKIYISNYSNDIYDEFCEKHGWHKIFVMKRTVNCANTTKKSKEAEYIYCNVMPPKESLEDMTVVF